MEVIPTTPEVGEHGAASGGRNQGRGGESVRHRRQSEGSGRLRHGALRCGRRLSVAVVEKDKVGGTCLHRGCVPAKEFLETAAVNRTEAGPPSSASAPGRRRHDHRGLRRQPASQAQIVDQLFKGLSGLLKGRGSPSSRVPARCSRGRRVRVVGDDGPRSSWVAPTWCWPPDRCPDHPGLRRRRSTGPHVGRGARPRPAPGSVAVIGGGAIGCEFARCSPTSGSPSRSSKRCRRSSWGVTRTPPPWWPVLPEAGIDVHTGVQWPATRLTRGSGTTVAFGDGGSSGSTPWWCRWDAARPPTAW